MRGENPQVPPTFDQDLFLWQGARADQERAADAARIGRIAAELAQGFAALSSLGPAVSIFGSARTPADHPTYAMVRGLAREVGRAGFAVITGGGGGLMEAANRGARDAGACSVGCCIELPREETENPYLDICVRFQHFFARKLMFVRYASAFLVTPGGFGTLDEMFEALTLIQTRIIPSFPVILAGEGEWEGLIGWLQDQVLADRRISETDLTGLHRTSDPAEVVRILREAQARQQLEDEAQEQAKSAQA